VLVGVVADERETSHDGAGKYAAQRVHARFGQHLHRALAQNRVNRRQPAKQHEQRHEGERKVAQLSGHTASFAIAVPFSRHHVKPRHR